MLNSSSLDLKNYSPELTNPQKMNLIHRFIVTVRLMDSSGIGNGMVWNKRK